MCYNSSGEQGEQGASINDRRLRVNYQIRVPRVRLIGEDGTQLGIVDRLEAMKMAQEKLLDLVEVVPTANPPVCRLMDYKRFLYEQRKKERELKKKQRLVQVKEIRFTPETSEHDYAFKKQHVEEFLREGHRVKVTVVYRGRGILHKERGYELLERMVKDLADVGKVERPPRLEGKRLSLFIIPI